jgi:hypothetical protein
MRSTRHHEKQVFGFAIVRVETYDADGALVSRCYEISQPGQGFALARQQSLRAARRWIVMRELKDFTQRRKARIRPGPAGATGV